MLELKAKLSRADLILLRHFAEHEGISIEEVYMKAIHNDLVDIVNNRPEDYKLIGDFAVFQGGE